MIFCDTLFAQVMQQCPSAFEFNERFLVVSNSIKRPLTYHQLWIILYPSLTPESRWALLFRNVWDFYHRQRERAETGMNISLFNRKHYCYTKKYISRHLRLKVMSTWALLHTQCRSGRGLPWWTQRGETSTMTSLTPTSIQSECVTIEPKLHGFWGENCACRDVFDNQWFCCHRVVSAPLDSFAVTLFVEQLLWSW